MKNITRDHANISYAISGSGDTTLLFVHGCFIDRTYWNEQIAYFNPHYKVVAIDLPGHGESGKERKHWSVEGFAEDVNSVIKELELENVILIGHSLGGNINLLAANLYPSPIVGFIGIECFKNAGTPVASGDEHQAESLLSNLKTNFADTNEQFVQMALVTPKTPPEISNRVIHDYRNAHQQMANQIMPEIFQIHQSERELLPEMKWKLFLINVDYIPTNEDNLMRYASSGYEVYYIKGTSHFPMLENPEELNRLLHRAIQKNLIHK